MYVSYILFSKTFCSIRNEHVFLAQNSMEYSSSWKLQVYLTSPNTTLSLGIDTSKTKYALLFIIPDAYGDSNHLVQSSAIGLCFNLAFTITMTIAIPSHETCYCYFFACKNLKESLARFLKTLPGSSL